MACATGEIQEITISSGGTGLIILADQFMVSNDSCYMQENEFLAHRVNGKYENKRNPGVRAAYNTVCNAAWTAYEWEIKTRLASGWMSLDAAEAWAKLEIVNEGLRMRGGWHDYQSGMFANGHPNRYEFIQQKLLETGFVQTASNQADCFSGITFIK